MKIELAAPDDYEAICSVLAEGDARDGCVPRRVALIDNVVVRASCRRRGIGSLLLARAEAWAIEHGASITELNVWSFNESAKRLYERLGYVTRTVRMERLLARS